jgi:hypothetical protein
MSNSPVFRRDSSRRQERARDPQGRLAERREKGLWSFLTWSFFLSQVATLEQASAAEAPAGGAGDEAGSAVNPGAGQAARNAFLPVEPAMLAEMQAAAPQATTQSVVQDATAPAAFLASVPGEPAGAIAPDPTEESSGARQTSAAPNAEAVTQSLIAVGPDSPSMEGAPGAIHLPTTSPADAGPGPVLGPVLGSVGDVVGDVVQVVDTVLEQVIAPVLGGVGDVLGDVVQALDPVLEQVVAPVLGGVGDVLGDVVQVLDPVLEQVVAPVLGGVGDVLGDVVQVLDPLVEQVVAPVLGSVGNVLGDVVQVLDPVVEQVVAPVLGGVGDVLGDVVQALDPVVEQVAAPVADVLSAPLASLLGLGAGGGSPILVASVVASSTSIDFEAGPAAASLPLDDLFSGGRYSDYNLTLQADVSAGANAAPGGSLLDIDIAAELSVLTGAAPTEGGPEAQGNAQHIGLPSLLGDTGLHWLGL